VQGFEAYKVLGELNFSTETETFKDILDLSAMRNLFSYLAVLVGQLGFVTAASLTDVATVGYATLNGG